MNKNKIYTIIIIVIIAVGIIVPIMLLTGQKPDRTPPTVQILSPNNTSFESQSLQFTLTLHSPDTDLDTIWYRIFNETGGNWVDATNVTWTMATNRTLGGGGVYTIYAWANDTDDNIGRASFTFTMIHLINYTGNTFFGPTLVVGTYDHVILQHGTFSVGVMGLKVFGLFDLINATFLQEIPAYNNAQVTIVESYISALSSYQNAHISVQDSQADLILRGNSTISIINTTIDGLSTYETVSASLDNVTITALSQFWENSTVLMIHAIVQSNIDLYAFSDLTIENSSTLDITVFDSAIVRIYFTNGQGIQLFENARCLLMNFTTSSTIASYGNTNITLLNSMIASLLLNYYFDSGNWECEYNSLSGTGTFRIPTLFLKNTTYIDIVYIWYISGDTQFFVNSSSTGTLNAMDTSNLTIYNSSGYILYVDNNAIASVFNSQFDGMGLSTNKTVYLENVTIGGFLNKIFTFNEGNIFISNDTFTGAESWQNCTLILGPNVVINNFYYSYYAENQVNLTIYNTTNISNIIGFGSSNISIYFSKIYYPVLYAYSNLTLYYCTITYMAAYESNNITLFNSSVTGYLNLYQTSFGTILDHSYVKNLYHYGSSGYYISGDSTVDNIVP